MKQYNQRCISYVVKPVNINKIAVLELPALTTVNDARPWQKVGVYGLRMPAAEPARRLVRSGAERERRDFHAKSWLGVVDSSGRLRMKKSC